MSLINKKILSIDFGSDEIKLVEGIYAKNGINVLKTFRGKLPRNIYRDGQILDKDKMISILKGLLKDSKINTLKTYAVVNSSAIITREVILPKVPIKEVGSLINMQLRDFLPVDPDDYVVNFTVLGNIGQDDAEKMKVLLIAIPKTIVISHLELIKEVGLKPEVLDYQGNAIAKLLNHGDFLNGNHSTRDIAIASIDIGYNSTKLVIIKNGFIEVSRVIDIGAKTLYNNLKSLFDYTEKELEEKVLNIGDITKEEENQDFTEDARIVNLTRTTLVNVMDRVDEIFKYYTSRENPNVINLILLQGGVSNIKELDNLFSNYFNIPSIKFDSLDKVKTSNALKTYSNAIGALIRVDEVKK